MCWRAAIACLALLALAGAAAAATQRGDGGANRLAGGPRADELDGRGGSDLLLGGRGADVLIGGRGPDRLLGGPGEDGFNVRDGVELAARGDDRIEARDGRRDQIGCGAGYDIAIVDAVEDGIYDCELVREPG